MRPFSALLLLALALAPSASALLVPPAGLVRQGETAYHGFDNGAGEVLPCLAVMRTYTVSLDYLPAGDVLTLGIVGEGAAVGRDGHAELKLVRSACTAFVVSVEGTDVATAAAYRLDVASGPAP